jgi:hypothetical protein
MGKPACDAHEKMAEGMNGVGDMEKKVCPR